METYEKLLEKAYQKVKVVEKSKDRFEVPAVAGQIAGRATILTNLSQIASYLRRDVNQLVKFLQKELATPGKIENDRLILNAKMNSQKVNEKIQLYAKEFVICSECHKTDTEIITEKGIRFKHCLACGAKSPIKHRV